MHAHYKTILRDTQREVARSLRIQNTAPDSPFYGAFSQPDGVYQAKFAIYRVAGMIACYCNPDSAYYHDAALLPSLHLGLDYILHAQHENGLFDYVTCNFLSAPDTAFCMMKLIPHYRYLSAQHTLTGEEECFRNRIGALLQKGAAGLLLGGFHTPNHRWAIASVLAICGKLFCDKRMTAAAGQYLQEGIDCNPDGEYSEKSAGNYNAVNNDAMLLLAEGLEDPSFEQPVLRNLRMMLTYWEPDDSVFTANSTRFDKDRLVYPTDYYIEYLSMGLKYKIPEFLAMANHCFDVIAEKRLPAPDVLIDLMLHPEWKDAASLPSATPLHYHAFYRDSGIARVRRGHYTYTVMRNKSDFLWVHNGSIKLSMKIGGSFCEHRAFKAETMTEENGAFHLHQVMRGWYYLPFREKPKTSDWWQMDHAAREKKLGPDMEISVSVSETDDGLSVDIQTDGPSGAPWRIELALRNISRISNPHMTMPIQGDEVLVLRDSYFTVENKDSQMTIGPAFGTHYFTEGKEDSEAKTPGAATVYLTDYTPFHHTIIIKP